MLDWLKKDKGAANAQRKQEAKSPLLSEAALRAKVLGNPLQARELAVRLQDASIGAEIHGLSLDIPHHAWIYLNGPNGLTKALFCDLCFGYLKPSAGQVQPRLQASEVSFLGSSPTTYGVSLMDHLSSGVRERQRPLFEYVAQMVFSPQLRSKLDPDSVLRTPGEKPLLEIDLSERDLMEIAEANLILQNRTAAIVDTTTDFYIEALEQGFRHSHLFKEARRTIFWINTGLAPTAAETTKTLSLDFGMETRLLAGIPRDEIPLH